MIAATPPAASANAASVRLTVAGDSLALGIGASDSSRGFAFDLYRRIAASRPGSEVTNLAIGGTTVADVLRLELPRVAATAPSVVLLEAGANDAIRRTPPAAFARAYDRLVRSIRRAAPRAKIVLFNVPDVALSPIFDAGSKPALRRLTAAYNLAIAATARRTGSSLVDLYALTARERGDAARFLSADQFHPSDVGHRAIADGAWPALRATLR